MSTWFAPSDPYGHNRMRKGGRPSVERWAFIEEELRHPEGCRRDDEFVSMATLDDGERGVYVNRRGKVTGQYTDGASGISKADREVAEGDEQIYRVSYAGEYEEIGGWKNVAVTPEGRFACWADDLEECGCCGSYHRPQFHGDCRDDAERYGSWMTPEQEGVYDDE